MNYFLIVLALIVGLLVGYQLNGGAECYVPMSLEYCGSIQEWKN
jgi:hypothetical protein